MKDTLSEHDRLMLESCATTEKSERIMRQTARSLSTLLDYRMYLLDEKNHIGAAESLSASDQANAQDVAAAVHEACSDAFHGYELWQGIHPVGGSRYDVRDKLGFEEACRRHQALILDLEKKL